MSTTATPSIEPAGKYQAMAVDTPVTAETPAAANAEEATASLDQGESPLHLLRR